MPSEIIRNISAKVAFSPTCNLHCIYCRGDNVKRDISASMEDFRRQPLETGCLSTEVLLDVLRHLHQEGLRQIRPTGGEPLLRKDWDVIVSEAARMGYSDVDITTNGILLETYLQEHGSLPQGLSIVKVSLDTHDPDQFRKITGGGDLQKVIEGIKAISGKVYTRANRVLTRSEMNEKELMEFITFCQEIGLNGVQYLDLVYYNNLPNANPQFWEREFVPFSEFRDLASRVLGVDLVALKKPDTGVLFHQAELSNGFKITFKDSTITRRDEMCQTCPVYCQEGRCLVRIATDGNVTVCPDYRGELPSFNVVSSIGDGTLHDEMGKIADIFISTQQLPTLETFMKKHGLKLKC